MGHRTALITAASIAIVIFAAAVAVGANLGILNAADSRPVGKLSAATVVQTTTSKAVHLSAAGHAGSRTAAPQKYIIRKAGTVSVSRVNGAIRLTDVKSLHGWTWTLAQTADKRLTVTFRSGARTYTFLAALGPHRSIVAKVDEPVTRIVPAAPAPSYSMAQTTSSATAAPASSSHSEEEEGGADD